MKLPFDSRYATWRAFEPRADLTAAASVAILLVPQALAYAALADAPPRMGVLTALAAPLAYAAFGGVRNLSIGPVALLALITADAQARLADQLEVAAPVPAMLSVGAGVVLLFIAFSRLGFLVRFVSEPVLTGFVAGAAVLIGASQLAPLLGIEVERASSLHTMLYEVVRHAQTFGPADAAIGLGALALLLTTKLVSWRPGATWARFVIDRGMPLVALAAAVALAALLARLGWESTRLAAIELDLGQLEPVPFWKLAPWRVLWPDAVAVAVLALVTARGVELNLPGDDRRDVGFHAASLGAAAAGVGLVGGIPPGVSVSRSAVLGAVGAASPAAPVLAGLIAGGGLLFAGDALTVLPRAALAAIIVSALGGVVDREAIRRVWLFHRGDTIAMLATFGVVLFLGIRMGLAVGALTSIGFYLHHTSQPRVVRLGRLDDSDAFRSVERQNVAADPASYVVLRIDEDLYFANAEYCDVAIRSHLDDGSIRHLVLDLRSVGTMDSSAVAMLIRLRSALAGRGVTLHLSTVNRRLKARLRLAALLDEVVTEDGEVHESVDDAVERVEADGG